MKRVAEGSSWQRSRAQRSEGRLELRSFMKVFSQAGAHRDRRVVKKGSKTLSGVLRVPLTWVLL